MKEFEGVAAPKLGDGHPRGRCTMARYIFSDSYAATVLPIIREIHREILAQKPPGAAISNRAIDRAIARALAARGVATMHGGSWTPAQVAALLDRRPPS
jgi:hypothetical protein